MLFGLEPFIEMSNLDADLKIIYFLVIVKLSLSLYLSLNLNVSIDIIINI